MKRFATSVTIAALVLLTVLLLYPLALVLDASMRTEGTGGLTLANYAAVLQSPYYLGSIRNSLLAAGLATLFSCAIGIPLAFCLARIDLPGRAVLLTLATLPLVLPAFVSAYALVLMFGHAGVITTALRSVGIPIGSIYGLPGIVIVFTLTLYPYVVLPVMAGFQAVDASMEEAARNLGGSRLHVFFTVLVPIVMPAIMAGGLLVFIEALENFGVPAVLAEDRPFLAVDIFKLFAGESDSNPAAAGALSVLLIGCTAFALFVQRHYLGKRRFATGARSAPAKLPLTPRMRLAAAILCWGIVIVSLLPFAAVLLVSFLRFRGPVLTWEFALSNYAALLTDSYQPLMNTIMLASAAAIATMLIGAPIGYVIARHRSRLSGLLDFVGMTPFAVSGTILAIGLILAFNSGPITLTGGWLIIVIAYVIRKIPFAIRSASAIVHQLDPTLEEASINLGVSPTKTFATLTVPLMASGLVGGFVLVWITAASELSATIVLYTSNWATMTVVMFHAVEGTGTGLAAASAAVLILVTAIPLLLVNRRIRRQEGAAI